MATDRWHHGLVIPTERQDYSNGGHQYDRAVDEGWQGCAGRQQQVDELTFTLNGFGRQSDDNHIQS